MSHLERAASMEGLPVSRALQWAGAGVGRRWRLPAPSGPVRVLRAVAVPMGDGVVLRADVYLPATAGPYPTLLVRTPYGRGAGFSLMTALPFAARGYAVVLQSARGTFGSTGEFEPVVNEAQDGQDTVGWLREQPWFDGRLGTIGPSYMGYAQWALALDPPPELAAMAIWIGPHDLARAGMEDGAFQLANLAIWTELIAHQERVGELRGQLRLMTAERRLAPHLDRLPLAELTGRLGGAPVPWFDEWLAHPELSDPYWNRYRATEALHTTTVPTLLVGGWQDWFLEQTLEAYVALRDRGVDVGLTVGPWAHLSIDSSVMVRDTLGWLGTHLPVDGARPGPARADRVRVYVTGARKWRGLADWPPAAQERTWYLASGGWLSDAPASGPGAATSFTYDPMHPTPSVGGRVLARRAGRRDNRRLEARDDVRTFTTAPLSSPMELLGSATVRLFLESDNPYADVFVRLCDVDARGRSINVTDRLVRLDPVDGEQPSAGERKVEVTLPDTAHQFRAGHRIRLQISGGAHPRYARNLGTGEPLGQATRGMPVTHRIGHSSASPSSVTLPVGGAASGSG